MGRGAELSLTATNTQFFSCFPFLNINQTTKEVPGVLHSCAGDGSKVVVAKNWARGSRV